MRDDIERQKEVGAAEQAFATVVTSSSSYRLCGGHDISVYPVRVGDVGGYDGMGRSRTKAVDQSTAMSLNQHLRQQTPGG